MPIRQVALSIILGAGALLGQNQPSFTPAPGSPITVGIAPIAVAVADLNGDGHPDIIAANAGSNSLTVLLGNGTGGFAASAGSPFTVGTYPGAIAIGDFNNDGHPDIVTANENSNNLSILLGDGKGGFAPAPVSTVAVGTGPQAVATLDVNGDGNLDIVSINSLSDSVTVLLGNGAGAFSVGKGSPFTLLSAPVSVGVADFNQDGFKDLAMGTGLGGIRIFLGNGAGSFVEASGSPYAAGLDAGPILVADFNGDGIADIAAGNVNGTTNNNLTVLTGTGTGGFKLATGSPFSVAGIPSGLAAGDFNGDGHPDIAVTLFNENEVMFLLGNGSGGFSSATPTFTTGSSPQGTAAADINGDGALDLIIANPGSGNLTVLLNGTARVSAPVISQGGVTPIYSASSTIQPGEFGTIYGSNLAAQTTVWNGDFATHLGGTTVTIDGNPAPLLLVSAGQINFQVPNDSNTGPVPVVVTTSAGSTTATVTIGAYAPSFLLLSAKYPAAIVPTTGPGNSGGGYDIIGPSGAFPYASRPVKAGEIVEIYAGGFGPTDPVVLAGAPFSGAAPCTTTPKVTIGGIQAQLEFAGIVEAGLVQLNVVIPTLPSGDQLLVASIGGATTQPNLYLTIQ